MTTHTTRPVLLAVDGNSLLHRSFHAMAASGLKDPSGEPIWAIKGMWSQLLGAVDRLRPASILIGFDATGGNHRHSIHPEYKAGRAEKAPELRSQLDLAPGHFQAAGIPTYVIEGAEADDVNASAAARAAAAGFDTIIVTSDRDAFALIDEFTSVLRVLNGGIDASPLITAARMLDAVGVGVGQYSDYAALRGDSSDNIPGVTGIGEKTAAKLLAAYRTVEEALADYDAGPEGAARLEAAMGKAAARKLTDPSARDRWKLNKSIMAMVTDLAVEDPSELRLPLDTAALQAELDRRALHSVRARALSLLGEVPSQRPEPAPAERIGTETPTDVPPDRFEGLSSQRPVLAAPKGRAAFVTPVRPAAWSDLL